MNNKIKQVVVVTDNSFFCMKKNNLINIIYTNFNNFISLIKNNNYDAIIIYSSKKNKPCQIIKNITNKYILKKIIVITNLSKPCLYTSCLYYKIHCILSDTSTNIEINNCIEEILSKKRHNEYIYNEISNELKMFGMSPKYNGFNYLKDSIYITIINKNNRLRLYNNIYDSISENYSTNKATVESSIRRIINTCWQRLYSIDELFINSLDYEKGIATNKEFIETIADRIRTKLEINLY